MASKLGTWWQKSRFHSWWQKIKQHPFITMGLIVLLIAFLAFALAVYWLGWGWTGFTGYSPPTPQYQRGKILWDWMQILLVPLMLAIGGLLFTRTQRLRDQEHEKLQRERDQQLADQRAELERELTRDNQREVALQAYLDKMSELLLEKKLRDTSVEEEEIREIARVRTLTVLRGLDPIA